MTKSSPPSKTRKRNVDSPFSWELATPEDLPDVIALCHALYAELDPKLTPPMSLEKVFYMMESLVEHKTVILYKNNGVACGILALDLVAPWWTEEKNAVLRDIVFYIKPEFRTFKAFSAALRLAEQYAKINKVPLEIFFFTDRDVKRKFKLFKHRGYTSQGFLVSKRFDDTEAF
jgi:hypothetical protein